eukprot:m.122222 g.122222  ORF g.122222 m.122222 type:complete len:323 (-) comp9391_c1_seq4:1782-2750(-)
MLLMLACFDVYAPASFPNDQNQEPYEAFSFLLSKVKEYLEVEEFIGDNRRNAVTSIFRHLVKHVHALMKALQPRGLPNETPLREKVINDVKSILAETRPIDMEQCVALVNLAKDAVKDLSSSQIVLFIGRTGAGKSTLSHALAGSKLSEVENERGLTHIDVIEAAESMTDITIARSAVVSETRYPRVFVMMGKKKLNKRRKDGSDNIYAIDTPGLFDTGCIAVIIANGLSIELSAAPSKSVIPVAVVSGNFAGTKSEAGNEVMEVIANMFDTEADECVLERIKWVFTHMLFLLTILLLLLGSGEFGITSLFSCTSTRTCTLK